MNNRLNIYLLRGLTRESGHWGSFIRLLQEDIPGVKVHLLDLPGSGKYVAESASTDIRKMVDFMRKDTIGQLPGNNGPNIICATSLGGMVASDWVIRYNTDFQGLVIINSSFKYICRSSERAMKGVRWDMLKILFAFSVRKREALIIKINSNKPEGYDILTDEWVKIQEKRKMSRMNILRQTIAGVTYGIKNEKPGIPLLIIGSRGDRMVCTECIKKIHAAFGGTLIWHPDAGHGLPIDDPRWLSLRIADWCMAQYNELKKTKDVSEI
jgi:pimeloyl-ACP methyl ester carboxylesterase